MFQKRKIYKILRYLGLVCVIALGVLSTVGSGGGGGGAGGVQPPPESSNWDEMVWDQDNWS